MLLLEYFCTATAQEPSSPPRKFTAIQSRFLACFHIRVYISTLCTQKSENLSAVKNTDRKMVF